MDTTVQQLQNKGVSDEVKRRNARTGLLLGLLALAFFIGFIVKFALTK